MSNIDEKWLWGIHTYDDNLFLKEGVIAIGWKAIGDLSLLPPDREAMKEIYCFANDKEEYDGSFTINSGICLGYIFIDLVRRIGGIKKIENPVISYTGSDIDFIHFNPAEEYVPDLDYFSDTDEYKKSRLLRFYSDVISDNLKHLGRAPAKLKRIVSEWKH